MNKKRTNCSFSVGLEPATPAYEAVTQSIPPPRCAVLDCVTASYAGVAGSGPTEKEQKFVRFSFIHNHPSYLYLLDSVSSSRSYSSRFIVSAFLFPWPFIFFPVNPILVSSNPYSPREFLFNLCLQRRI